eukprot:c15383_g1_i2.p1 GENE.c15383_g1_i2~~c15383_g1_i2.p1  ORF type:complete len:504 (+),score=116.62 c15383_g1_i2:62-1513(+)
MSPRSPLADEGTPTHANRYERGFSTKNLRTAWPSAAIIAYATFIDVSVHTLQIPLFPELKQTVFHDSSLLLSLYFYAYNISSIASFALYPIFGRHGTTRTLILGSQALFVASCILLWLKFDPSLAPWVALVARCIQGGCGAVLWIASSLYLYDEFFSSAPAVFVSAIAWQYASENFAYTVAPSLGGLLDHHAFFLVAVASLIGILLVYLYMPPHQGLAGMDDEFEYSMFSLYYQNLSPSGILMIAVTGVMSACLAMLEMVLPQFFARNSVSRQEIGFIFALYGFIVIIGVVLNTLSFIQRLSPKYGRMHVTSISMWGFMGAFFACWFITAFSFSLALCVGLLLIVGIFNGFLTGLTGSVLADAEKSTTSSLRRASMERWALLGKHQSSDSQNGVVVDLSNADYTTRTEVVISLISFQFIWDVGRIVGPFVVGFMDLSSDLSVIWGFGAFTALCGVIVLLLSLRSLTGPTAKEKALDTERAEDD